MFLEKSLVLSVILLSLVNLSNKVNGLYIQLDNVTSKESDSSIIENLKIAFVHPKNYENSSFFPSQFSVNFKKFNKKFNVSFKLINKIDQYYPLKSSNVYVIDKKHGRPIQKSNLNKIDGNYGLYTEEGGLSYAVLIRNSNNNQNSFRLIATLHNTPEKSEKSGTVFDIIPLKTTSNAKKRNAPAFKNDHIIFKRGLKERDFLFRNKRQHALNNYEDYLVIDEHKDRLSVLNKAEKNLNQARVINSEPHKLYVETLLVTELSFYNNVKKYTGISDQVILFEYMKIYLSHVINGVNLRYKYSLLQDPDLKLVVKLTNFLFLTEPADIQWANASLVGDPKYPTYNGNEVILAKKTLHAFTSYMNSKKFDFEYDHAAALFSKDLWGEPESSDADYEPYVAGFATLGEICGENRYSINEEFGGFQNTGIIAHEIAHNLGSFHDGEDLGVDCPFTDNYIMSPNQVNNNLNNINKFSPCSIRQFKNTLLESNYTKISAQAQCLINAPSLDNQPLETILAELVYPGHIWSPDDQCKMRMGHKYTFCQDQLSNICSVLFCRNATDTQCSGFVIGAAEGTYCGFGKMCIEGACVKHAYLDPPPSFSSNHLFEEKSSEKDHCLYGDYDLIQGPYYESFLQSKFGFTFPKSQVTCQEILDHAHNNLNHAASAYCEDFSFRTMCCNTCRKYNALICTDQLFQCPQYMSIICESGTFDSVAVSAVCQETCGLCTGSNACVDLYEYCSIYANKCENGTISNIPIGLVCAKSCGDCAAKPLQCKNSEHLCKNGATCINVDNNENSISLFGFKCVCPLGYHGEYCEKKDPCLPNPCNNGGSCQRLGSYEYFCSCTKSCSGFNCNNCQVNTITSSNSGLELLVSNSTTSMSTLSTKASSSSTFESKITLSDVNGDMNVKSECQDMPGKEFQCRYYAVVFDFCEKYAFVNGMVFTEMCPKTCHICDQTTTTRRVTRKKVANKKKTLLKSATIEDIIEKKKKAQEEHNIKMQQARDEQSRRLEKQNKAGLEEERRLVKEKKAKEELERLIKERKAKRREEKEKKKKEEAERRLKEERERLEKEQKDRDVLNKYLQEEKVRLQEEESKRKQREKEEREEKERLLQEKKLQDELERLLKAAQEEEERLLKQKQEQEERERLHREKLEREEKERIRAEMDRLAEETRREEERILREKQAQEEFERLLEEARAEEERKYQEEQRRILEEKRQREEETARLLKEKKAKEEEERLLKIKKAEEEHRRLVEEKRQREEEAARLLKEKKAKEEEERLLKIKKAQEEKRKREEEATRLLKEENERIFKLKKAKEEKDRRLKMKKAEEEQRRILEEKRQREEEAARLLKEKKAKEEEERLLVVKKAQEEQRRLMEEKRQREEEAARLLKEKKAKEEEELLLKIKKEKENEELTRLLKEKKLREENERRLQIEKNHSKFINSQTIKKDQDRLLKEKKLKEERDRILNEKIIKEDEARASLERFLKQKQAREEEERMKSLHLTNNGNSNSFNEYVLNVCEDSGWNSCAKWAMHCDLLKNHYPHPCRKTCGLCQ